MWMASRLPEFIGEYGDLCMAEGDHALFMLRSLRMFTRLLLLAALLANTMGVCSDIE